MDDSIPSEFLSEPERANAIWNYCSAAEAANTCSGKLAADVMKLALEAAMRLLGGEPEPSTAPRPKVVSIRPDGAA